MDSGIKLLNFDPVNSALVPVFPTLLSSAAFRIKTNGDLDDYFDFSVTANRPLFRAIGSYLVLGADGTPGSATADGDVFIKQALEVDGILYGHYGVESLRDVSIKADEYGVMFGASGSDAKILYTLSDVNAGCLHITAGRVGADVNNVPILVNGRDWMGSDLGLFDGLTQPSFVSLEKVGKLHSATDGIADAGGPTAILKHVGGFAAAVVGDLVRITAGTNCTIGFYWITTVTSADQVTLDRNYATNDSINVTFVTYHDFSFMSAEGVKTRVTDGAPGAGTYELKMPGRLSLDVGVANGRLYWSIGNDVFHYVDATAGISFTKEEIEMNNHHWNIGDIGLVKIDKYHEDGAPHGLLYSADDWLNESSLAKRVAKLEQSVYAS